MSDAPFEAPTAAPLVLKFTVFVHADGFTSTRTEHYDASGDPIISPVTKDVFWDARKHLAAVRRQLTKDIKNGPQTCPFGALNPDREG